MSCPTIVPLNSTYCWGVLCSLSSYIGFVFCWKTSSGTDGEGDTRKCLLIKTCILSAFSCWRFTFSLPRLHWREAVLCVLRGWLQDRHSCSKDSYLSFQKGKNADLFCSQPYLTQGSVVVSQYLYRDCCTSPIAWAIPGCNRRKEFEWTLPFHRHDFLAPKLKFQRCYFSFKN